MFADKSVIIYYHLIIGQGILTLVKSERIEKKKMYISNFHWLFSHLACFKHFEEIVGNRLFSSLVRQSNSSLFINVLYYKCLD